MTRGYYLCTRCGHVCTVSTPVGEPEPPRESRCYDPKAPGGYWYCSWVELVPAAKGGLPSLERVWEAAVAHAKQLHIQKGYPKRNAFLRAVNAHKRFLKGVK